MKSALITGVTGQDGAYLAQLLLEKGYKVVGGMRRNSQNEVARLERLGIARDIEFVDLDLADPNNVTRVVKALKPTELYNLAAHSFVGSSWEQPQVVADINALGVLRLLEAVRTYSESTCFYQASTSELFGRVREVPQNELTAFYPRSPYGVAKAYGHYITVNYRESFDMHASSGILFNHESPLRGIEFVTRKITRGLAAIKAGGSHPVELGNLDSRRDWGFAGDYVEGMWRMLQQPQADDYVLATGVAATIREFVGHAASALEFDCEWSGSGIDEVCTDGATGTPLIRVNERFYRPAEVDLLVGDPSKAERVLDWTATTTLQQLAQMMAEADYEQAVAEAA